MSRVSSAGRFLVACAVVSLALAAGLSTSQEAYARWDHRQSGGYDVWSWDGAQKFRRNLSTSVWDHYSTVGATWYDLGGAALPSTTFIGDGGFYNLGNGFTYSYVVASNLAYFKKGGVSYRFEYLYGPGRWCSAGSTGGWQLLGNAGVSASFVGDSALHDLKNGFSYSYVAASDLGYFRKGGIAYRFGYYYGLGQWMDAGSTRRWKALGKAGLSAAFIGDGTYRALGQGFDYKYDSDKGYFTFDDPHQFRQSYANGSWEYLANNGNWTGWTGTFLAPLNGITANLSNESFFIAGGSLYLTAYDGTGYGLYLWNGSAFNRLASNVDVRGLGYLTTVNGQMFFTGWTGTYATGKDLYSWNGTTFQQLSNMGFARLYYFTTANNVLYLDGNGGSGHTGEDLYSWNGTTFQQLSNMGFSSTGFTPLNFLTTVNNVLYLDGYGGTGHTGWDLYRWDGTTFQQLSNMGFDTYGLRYFTTLNNVLYFGGDNGTGHTGWDLYSWNGTTFQQLSNMGFSYGVYSALHYFTTVNNVLYFEGKKGTDHTGWDLYSWNGATFAQLSNMGFAGLHYFTTVNNVLCFEGEFISGGNPLDDLYSWNGTTFAQLSNMGFASLDYFTTVNNVLYFGGYGGTGHSGNDLYSWNGTTFVNLSNMGFDTYGLCYFTTLNNVLYFGGSGGTGHSGWDLYRWNGTTLAQLSNMGFYGVYYVYLTTSLNNVLYLNCYGGTGHTGNDLYRWNGTTFVASTWGNSSPDVFATAFGGDLFFPAFHLSANSARVFDPTYWAFLKGRM